MLSATNVAGFSEKDYQINLNLVPNGTQISVGPGEHIITIAGNGCTDTLWTRVIPATVLEIDTVIYMS